MNYKRRKIQSKLQARRFERETIREETESNNNSFKKFYIKKLLESISDWKFSVKIKNVTDIFSIKSIIKEKGYPSIETLEEILKIEVGQECLINRWNNKHINNLLLKRVENEPF